MKEKLKSIILSKEASYWGFFVPAMVNSIACFLYSMGSNVTLGAINGMLMLYFTGCYYLFCLYYFWNKEKKVITCFLFIIVPIIIYATLIQPFIAIDIRALDLILTSLYYIAFYGLFVIKNEPSKNVKYVIISLSWLIFSPLFLFLSWKWKLVKTWKRVILVIISPSSWILLLLVVIGCLVGYGNFERRHKFTNRETLHEITGVMLPNFKVTGREEGKRSFHGDYSDEATIQFKEVLSRELYLQLDSLCCVDANWSKSNVDSRVYYRYNRMWGNGMPAPQGQNDDEDYFLDIVIQQGSQQAKITYGMW